MNKIMELTVKDADAKVREMPTGRRDTAHWLHRRLLAAQWDADKGRPAIETALLSLEVEITEQLVGDILRAFGETFTSVSFILWFDYLLNEAT
jgi:hypothetical protein